MARPPSKSIEKSSLTAPRSPSAALNGSQCRGPGVSDGEISARMDGRFAQIAVIPRGRNERSNRAKAIVIEFGTPPSRQPPPLFCELGVEAYLRPLRRRDARRYIMSRRVAPLPPASIHLDCRRRHFGRRALRHPIWNADIERIGRRRDQRLPLCARTFRATAQLRRNIPPTAVSAISRPALASLCGRRLLRHRPPAPSVLGDPERRFPVLAGAGRCGSPLAQRQRSSRSGHVIRLRRGTLLRAAHRRAGAPIHRYAVLDSHRRAPRRTALLEASQSLHH